MRRQLAVCAALVAVSGCTGATTSADPLPSVATLSAPPAPAVVAGQPACPVLRPGARGGLPALRLRCLGPGGDIDLGRLRGPALVNVWASWCEPCQREMPELEALHRVAGDRLLVLGVVSEDSAAKARSLVEDLRISYPSVLDEEGDVRRHLGVIGPPITLLIDRNGRIVKRYLGVVPAPGAFRAEIRAVLGVKV